MSDRMIPIPFDQLMNWIFTEKKSKGTVFGIRRPYISSKKQDLKLFGERMETPFGPAAGPNSQLAQNIVASYYAGSRFFELKTVQKLDGEDLPVNKPCILAEDECYNCEWSTELYVPQAFDEYVKAWWACKIMALEFGLGDPDGFMFNMSVGYDLEGIKTKKIDDFIEGLKEAKDTPIWKECKAYALAHVADYEHVTAEDIEKFSSKVCTSITLSTLHGCPPQEIERIATYLITEKKLNTFIKCNPTLLGYEYARKTMDEMGYDYVQFGDFHFRDDLQYSDAVPMLQRLLALATEKGLAFGVKLTNTFPVDVKRNELPSEEMYMSGRSLYALTLSVAKKLSHDFDGKLRISYSGGAEFFNIDKIFKLGIWPITMATTVLKPGGYNRMVQIAELIESKNDFGPFTGVDVAGLDKLLEEAKEDPHHVKAIKPAPSRKIAKKVPLTDCFFAPCEEGCPINQDITTYMKLEADGKHLEAMKVIGYKNPLPFITGTICAHRCMGRCTRNFYEEPVQIRSMKLAAAEAGYASYLDYVKAEAQKIAASGKKAAVIGGGPAGLACAFFLARAGVDTTIFEKRETLGGIVRNVIPSFRISNDAIAKDVELAKAMGVKIETGKAIKSLDELKGFDAVVLAIGAEKQGNVRLESGSAMNAIEFLEKFKSDAASLNLGKNIVVIGGGNTAMDTARAAKKLAGVEHSYLVYRRDRRNMPADEDELKLALLDGVEFKELLAPIKLENGKLVCEKQALGEYDASGRRGIVATGEFVEVTADTVIAAVGEKVDGEFYKSLGLAVDEKGKAVVDAATAESSVKGVYVVGDAQRGPATVVEGIRDARLAADAIIASTSFKAADSKLMSEASELIDQTLASKSIDELTAKKGTLAAATDCDAKRCLGCNTVCENCVDVCPNRANVAIKVPGSKLEQVVHVDRMCNECGNCLVFCPYSSSPYKEKFTVFMDMENFENSTNEGFVLVDEESKKFTVRLGGRVSTESVYDDSCKLPSDIKALIKAVFENYRYIM